MFTTLNLDDVRSALQARDPELVRIVTQLAVQPDQPPTTPIREGAYTWNVFQSDLRAYSFRKKSREEQMHFRIEKMKILEAPDAEVPLPDRMKLHEIIRVLWEDNGPFARSCLLRIIDEVQLTYGPWRALKSIFKEAEARNDTEVLGALSARFDAALSGVGHNVSAPTLSYLCRRGWRYLRRLAIRLPACYADAAVDFLAGYTDRAVIHRTWIAAHIFFHESKKYNRSRFTLHSRPNDLLTDRAFADLWKRSPRPLFALLERARSEVVREFATSALKTDFRALLREVEPAWVARLVNAVSKTIDSFVVWILNNVPRFEQAAFRTLGLHEPVLRLFDSPANDAREYAAQYARTHARDLPVSELIRLANNDHETVRKLANDLLQERDPRRDVGLEAWGTLLEKKHGHSLAAEMLRRHFGAAELTPAWFMDRLFSSVAATFDFAKTRLPQVHSLEHLGAGFFRELIDRTDNVDTTTARRVIGFALQEMVRFDVNTLSPDFLRDALLNPLTGDRIRAWINEGRLRADVLGAEFFKTIAFHPAWDTDPWFAELRSRRPWAQRLTYSDSQGDAVLAWLGDPRRFPPTTVGLPWLLQLAGRAEPRYHDYAVELMIRSFVPADFAPLALPTTPRVDLGGASFVFTGRLASMTRDQAEEMIRQANGVPLQMVSSKIHHLVVGDEGSALLGRGPKTTKLTRVEELNSGGANIRIMTETALLETLTGTRRAAIQDATLAGCQRLWEMATAPGVAEAAVGQFARKYIRRHHPVIAPEENNPFAAGSEIPLSFLTFDLVRPLYFETRRPLREFALMLAKWEFARWNPPVDALLKMSEAPHGDVRNFTAQALLAEDKPENRRYRLNPDVLPAAAVYSFCESPEDSTRTLGMELIKRYPRLQLPEELFRLTESPDRKVRGFVIRVLWSLYRDRGITDDWKPTLPPQTTVGSAARKAAAKAEQNIGTGAPAKPAQFPVAGTGLTAFLRRILFEIPPGRSEKKSEEEQEGITIRLKPLPARKAKLSLVEVLRDLAMEEPPFAQAVLPVLREFMVSRGKSERDACLVAVTRIQHTAQ